MTIRSKAEQEIAETVKVLLGDGKPCAPPWHANRLNMGAIAREMFSVQPMTAPVGAIFYMDYMDYRKTVCNVEGHEAFGKPIGECEHQECAVRDVLES